MDTTSRMRAVLRVASRELAVFLLFLALAAFASRPLIAHLSTYLPGFTDPFVDLWTINWLSAHFFDPRTIFQGNTFYPEPHAVLFSDLSLGTVVLILPFRLVVSDPVTLYNLALLLALAFGGWAFHALARELTGSRSAGILAGVLAAFSSHQTYHLYHINLLTIGWLALFLLGLHRILRRPTVGAMLLTGVAFALNAQSSGYYAVTAVLLALVFAAIHFKTLRIRRQTVAVLGSIGIAAILTAPYVFSYLSIRSDERLYRPVAMSARMSFSPEKDLGHDGYLYRHFLRFGGEQLFPGMLALALAGVALFYRRSHGSPVSQPPSPVKYISLSALACLLVSLGPYARFGGFNAPLPYLLLHCVPIFDSMRHPFTFASVAVFLLAILSGVGWSKLGLASRRWAGVAVVALAVLETSVPPRKMQHAPRGLPLSYRMLRGFPRAPILEIPLYAEETLLWAARHDMPVVNGQGSAFVPFRIRALEAMMTNQWLRRTPSNLDHTKPARRLREMFERLYVIIPSVRKPELKPLAEAFDQSTVFTLLAISADGDRIYSLGDLKRQRRLGAH